jgi:isopenicillin N synthase-like dioxygenase
MDLIHSVLENSYAIVDVSIEMAQAAERVCGMARRFFSSQESAKERYHTDAGEGFRAFATEYTDEPYQTDLVECFSCSLTRQSVRDRFPAGAGLALYDTMLQVQHLFAREAERLANDVLRALGSHPPDNLEFERWSRLQVNHADMTRGDRDLLHVVHQDGNFLTLAFSTGPGLNVFRRDGSVERLWPESAGKLVVLAGEILSIVSGGRIGAAFHCVERRTDISQRLAVLYFADAEPELLAQYASGDVNEIRDRISAAWLRSGVAPVQPHGGLHRAKDAN